MNVREYIRNRIAIGRPAFSIIEIKKETGLPYFSLLKSLRRLFEKGEVVSPYQGFYVGVPDSHALHGCLPAEELTVLLMEHLQEIYYVGLLSAAQYYGAAHQKPQTFQIVLRKARKDIICGKTRLLFVSKVNVKNMPYTLFKTPRGFLRVATPEVVAMDLVSYPRRCGGIDNVATVLKELSEHISAPKLIDLSEKSGDVAWVQRLGYIFSFLDLKDLSLSLLEFLKGKKTYFSPLDSFQDIKGCVRDKTWKIIINHNLDPDQ